MKYLERTKWEKIIDWSVLLVFVLIIFWTFSQQNKKRIFEQNSCYLQDNTVEIARNIDVLLTDALNNIKVIAYLYGKNLSNSSVSYLDLAKLQNHSYFDHIRYTDSQGLTITADGKTFSASDREHFINGMKGTTGISITERSVLTSETLINFYTPLWFDGEIIGVLRGIYCADNKMKELLNTCFWGERVDAFLCLPDGKMIVGNYKNQYSDNLLKCMIKQKNIDAKEAEKITDAFATGRSIGFTYQTAEGTSYGYMVKLKNIDCFLVQIFPVQITQNMYEQANRTGVIMECSLIVLFLFYIIFGLIKNYKYKQNLLNENMDNKRLMLHEKLRNDQYRKVITSGASMIYEINLSQNCLEAIITYDEKGRIIALDNFMGFNIPCCFSDFIFKSSLSMSDKERKQFIKNNNVDYLISCFNQGKMKIQLDYDELNYMYGYRNMRKNYFFTQDDETKDIYVMIITKDISDEIKQKNVQEMKLQSQMEIIRALGREYSLIYLFNLKNDVLKLVLSSDKHQSFIRIAENNDSYIEIFSAYAKAEVCSEDRDGFLEAVKLNNVIDSLRDNEAYEVNYRLEVGGRIYYNQLRFIQIKQKNDFNIAFAFRSIDEIIKKELEQKRILSEALKKAKSAEKAKSIFLFNMSHDIRTPMNAIIGFNSLAQKNIDNKAKVLDALKKVEFSSHHLLDLINDVLDMARIESGKIELNEQVIDVDTHFAVTVEMFSNEMKAKGLDFVADNQTKTKFILADGMRLKQVASNLLSNAIKFTKAGGKVIYRVLERGSHEDGTVDFEIHVQDNGIGMSWEFQKNIFSVFERERSSTVSGIPGTGLGLAISQSIAYLMGGSLTCSSELDKGSEFVFAFRVKAVNRSLDSECAKEIAAETEFNFRGKKVLLAEDNELNREIATEILSSYGFEVVAVDDGLTAVEMIKDSDAGYYDLVLMDIQMPHMDGYEATKAIRALEDETLSAIPIIAMTANAFEEDRKKALASGMNAHIAKPFEIKNLCTILKNFLG